MCTQKHPIDTPGQQVLKTHFPASTQALACARDWPLSLSALLLSDMILRVVECGLPDMYQHYCNRIVSACLIWHEAMSLHHHCLLSYWHITIMNPACACYCSRYAERGQGICLTDNIQCTPVRQAQELRPAYGHKWEALASKERTNFRAWHCM